MVVAWSAAGFAVSLAIHITAYFRIISVPMFLLYCRVEWLGVAIAAALLGWLMPSPTPRRQLLMLVKWSTVGLAALSAYLAWCAAVYVSEEHPVIHHGLLMAARFHAPDRPISDEMFVHLTQVQQRFYLMNLNRAFSLLWVILFLGITLYSARYLRDLRRAGVASLQGERFVPWWYASS